MKREGYNPRFIDEHDETCLVNHPELSPRTSSDVYREENGNIYFNYIHYTVVMNKKARQPLYVASNIDQNNLKEIKRHDDPWDKDNRVPKELQLDNSYYSGAENPYDRGHLVRRLNNCWGDTVNDALRANNDTFFYTNVSFQHEYFNRDEWLALEDMFLDWKLDDNGRLCVFTGPVWRPFDRCFHREWEDYARIPSAFFKIICYKGKESGKLETRAFLLYQDEEFTNNKQSGSRVLKTNRFAKYQVSIGDIENLTGLEFDNKIPSSNPIYYNTPKDPEAVERVYRYPERVPIIVKEDLVNDILAERSTQEAREENKTIDIVAALVNPVGYDSKKEWLSLFNKSTRKVDLNNWGIINQNGQVMKLKGEILSGQSKKFMTKDFPGFSLANSDGILVLRNDNGDTVDIVTYTKKEAEEAGKILRF
jgi:endonuclease G, mitochondrial